MNTRPLHDYDATLKKILTRSGSLLLRKLTGSDSLKWLNVELHRRGSMRVDLLGRTSDGRLIHIELQSRNESGFHFRMGEYGFAVAREHGCYPEQIALFVGQEPLRMQNDVQLPLFPFRFHVVDVRDLETEEVVRRVLAKIARAKRSERKEALAELVTIAGLRRLGDIIGREVKEMPILEDIMDHDLFGPKLRKAHAEGQSQGQLALLLRMAERKFGRIPAATRKRLESLKPLQLERAGLRLLDAKKMEDIFAR